MSTAKTKQVCRKYDTFSANYDKWDSEHRSVSRQRRQLVRGLKGRILEVGVGTGINLEYYLPEADVTGADVSRGMLEHAAARLRHLPPNRIKLLRANAERLPFLEDTFDVVVGTFVFSSFGDPKAAAVEIKRVLRRGGRFVTLGYHTKMVLKILRQEGWRIRSQQEWKTDDRPIGRIVASKAGASTRRVERNGKHPA